MNTYRVRSLVNCSKKLGNFFNPILLKPLKYIYIYIFIYLYE